MTRVEDIQTGIWADDDVRALSPHAKLLYIWSFTNSLCNPAGLYRVGKGVIAQQTGLTPEELRAACSELEAARFVMFESDYLWVRSRVANYRSRSSNVAKSIANSVGRLDYKHPLRVGFLFEYEGEDWLADALAPLILHGSSDPDLGAAMELLSSLLADGPRPSREVMQAAMDASISQSLLRKAKAELEIQSAQSTTGWLWVLPTRASDPNSDLALDGQARMVPMGVPKRVPMGVPGEGDGEGERSSTSVSTATSKPSSLNEKFSVHSARKNSSVKTEKAREMLQAPIRAAERMRSRGEWVRNLVPEISEGDSRVAIWVDTVLKHSERGREVMNNRRAFRAAVAHTWPEYAELIRRNDEENNHAA